MEDLEKEIGNWHNTTPHDMGKKEFDALIQIIKKHLTTQKEPVAKLQCSASLAVLLMEVKKKKETARARKLHHAKEECYLFAAMDRQEEITSEYYEGKISKLLEIYS